MMNKKNITRVRTGGYKCPYCKEVYFFEDFAIDCRDECYKELTTSIGEDNE